MRILLEVVVKVKLEGHAVTAPLSNRNGHPDYTTMQDSTTSRPQGELIASPPRGAKASSQPVSDSDTRWVAILMTAKPCSK